MTRDKLYDLIESVMRDLKECVHYEAECGEPEKAAEAVDTHHDQIKNVLYKFLARIEGDFEPTAAGCGNTENNENLKRIVNALESIAGSRDAPV